MFSGIYPAIITPFKADGSVDFAAFVEVLKHQEKAGAQGFYFAGTGGEGLMLTRQERQDLLQVCMREKEASTQVIVHVSAFFPEDSLGLMQHAAEVGADAVALIPPGYYSPLDDEAVFQFYQRMTSASPLPMMIYHLPAYSHYTISSGLFERLAALPGVIGVKDSAGDVMRIFSYARYSRPLVVLNGHDETTLTALLNGAQGVISGPANIMVEKFTALWSAFQQQNLRQAAACQTEINQVLEVLEQYPLVPAIKQMGALLQLPGMKNPAPRLPSRSLSAQEIGQMRLQMEKIGMI